MPGCMDDLRTVLSRLVLGAVVSAKKLARLFIALIPLSSDADADWAVLFIIWGGVSSRRGAVSCLVLSCLLTLYTAVMSFEILFPFGLHGLWVFEPSVSGTRVRAGHVLGGAR